MATLGRLWSQQLGFTVTTTAGTIYTHGLGFTPTIVQLTIVGTTLAGTVPMQFCYTLANATTITIGANQVGGGLVDVLCGSLHSLVC